jgi:hypothetical protein
MEFKLSQILESTILLEGRREDVIKKYGEDHTELVDMFVDVDPSGNNKYLEWMVKTALGKNQDDNIPMADDIARTVNDFHRNLTRIQQKDINNYKSLNDLKSVVEDALVKEKEKRVSKEAAKIYEKGGVVIYAPFTVEASCKYGAGSKWCIAGTGGPNGLNTYFDSYSEHSNFYFFINNNLIGKDDRNYKYALQWRFDGDQEDLTWWDAKDDSHRETPDWVTPEMMSAVRSFNPSHTKKKLETKIISFIEDPNYENYLKFKNYLTPEQKISSINKIISKGNLNSRAFGILASDLNDKQKMDFITNYVKGTVNANDYKQMQEHLTESQKMILVQYNPSILNNIDIMTELNQELTDDQKYQLSKKVDAKQINNTDSKVLFRKWSMSSEERAKHGQTSFYVFLSSPSDYVEKLVKVDPLDPESYRLINMMKLRKQIQQGTDMYGIKTESGLLDDYVGKTTSDINSSVLDTIKQKAVKI